MTQKDKELLLKDICGRLPYGVKVQVYNNNRYALATLTKIDVKKQECVFNFNVPVENCLPYLRSMSSMTDVEKDEITRIREKDYQNVREWCRNTPVEEDGNICPVISYAEIDFCNKKHFDYRGLIEKGLALEASEEMYIIK